MQVKLLNLCSHRIFIGRKNMTFLATSVTAWAITPAPGDPIFQFVPEKQQSALDNVVSTG
jgi:hypothetical protein